MTVAQTSVFHHILKSHRTLIEQALAIRATEEKLLHLFAEGKLNGTVHTCVGQELNAVCVAAALKLEDYVVSNHRGHGHYIARTGNIRGLLAEVTGKQCGVSGGIGGSQHLYGYHFLANGIQGGMTPIAAGLALAAQLRATQDISVAFIGDGTLGEGILYETMNIAAIWQLPLLLVLENNHYAQSTSMSQTFVGSVEERVRGFGLRYFKGNSWDVAELVSVCQEAADTARAGVPVFLEIDTYRLNPHSKGDDNRDTADIEAYRAKDVLNQCLAEDAELRAAYAGIRTQIDQHVRDLEPEPKLTQVPAGTWRSEPVEYAAMGEPESGRMNELLYQAMKSVFETKEAVLIGEDSEYQTPWTAKPYGGAFKVSKDLSVRFPGRVRNTPISEAAIVGVGTGLAIAGIQAFVEIMFGDFTTLILDQLLQHAAKFPKMFGGNVSVPLVVRTPMGGRRGYGPTHSQSLEKFFLGIPDLNILAMNDRIHPSVLLAGLNGVATPTLLIENKVVYTRGLNDRRLPGFHIQLSNEVFPTLRVTPEGVDPSVTVVCYGGLLEEVEKAIGLAFDQDEILCEVICPTQIQPLNLAPIAESVAKTGRLVVVEEGPSIAGFGSEVCARLAESGVRVDQFVRLGTNTVIPCSLEAELNLLPGTTSILEAIRRVC
jgi:2-oxoisovalerate dehydrogenase E1 component